MLRRIGFGVLFLIVIIVAAAAIAPYFVGRAAEKDFRNQIAYINSRYPQVVVHVDSYHRGFYSSEADLSFAAGEGGNGNTSERVWELFFGGNISTTKIHLRINHGPIPFAAFGGGHVNFMPVLYTASFRGEQASSLSLIGVLKPEVYTVEYFTGATNTTLTVPPGKFATGPAAVTWQGGHFEDELNSTHDRMHYSGEIKQFGFTYQDAKTGGSYGGSLKGFTFSGAKSKAGHDFWVGEDRVSSKGSQFERDGKTVVTLAPSDYRGGTSETPDGQWLSASGHFRQQGGELLGWSWSDLEIQGALNKLDAQGLRQAMDELRAEQRNAGHVSQASSLALIESALPKAIRPETQGSFKLALNAPDGSANVDVSGGFDAPVPASAAAAAGSDAASLLERRADWHMTVDFDRKLVDGFSLKVLGAPSGQSVDRVLEQWQKQGYLRAGSTGRYHSQIVFRAGVLKINGRTLSTGSGTRAAPGSASSG